MKTMIDFQKIYNSPEFDIRNSTPYWSECDSDDDNDVYITADSTYKGVPVIARWAFPKSMSEDTTDLDKLEKLKWEDYLYDIKIDGLRCAPYDDDFECTKEEAMRITGLDLD